MNKNKIDLEQMSRDLNPDVCYKEIVEIEKLLQGFCEINSSFYLGKTELVKKISLKLYENGFNNFSHKMDIDKNFERLQTIIDKKRELILKLKESISLIEDEINLHKDEIDKHFKSYKNT